MRKRLVVGNWKMNKTPSQAVDLCKLLKPQIDTTQADVVFCVPAIDIVPVAQALEESRIAVGAQDMSFEDNGAYTGQISGEMLTDAGCTYVILGHSERRMYSRETSEDVSRKMRKALENGLIPIMCCGETLEQRDSGLAEEIIHGQIETGFRDIPTEKAASCVIAYEPIWAIGTGRSATAAQAEDICRKIRHWIAWMYTPETAEKMRILYGGSVNSDNAAEFFAQPDIDGGLVGGVSLKPEFGQVVSCG